MSIGASFPLIAPLNGWILYFTDLFDYFFKASPEYLLWLNYASTQFTWFETLVSLKSIEPQRQQEHPQRPTTLTSGAIT